MCANVCASVCAWMCAPVFLLLLWTGTDSRALCTLGAWSTTVLYPGSIGEPLNSLLHKLVGFRVFRFSGPTRMKLMSPCQLQFQLQFPRLLGLGSVAKVKSSTCSPQAHYRLASGLHRQSTGSPDTSCRLASRLCLQGVYETDVDCKALRGPRPKRAGSTLSSEIPHSTVFPL